MKVRWWVPVAAVLLTITLLPQYVIEGPKGLLQAIAGIVTLAAMVALYVLPSLVARSRGHRQVVAITALNLLAGWTFFGWVAALVWALVKPSEDRASGF